MSVAVSIVFTGLCALVTDGGRRPAQVLLVDAKAVGEVRGVTLPEHAPTLVAALSTLANPEASGPTRVVTAWPGRGSAAASPPKSWVRHTRADRHLGPRPDRRSGSGSREGKQGESSSTNLPRGNRRGLVRPATSSIRPPGVIFASCRT